MALLGIGTAVVRADDVVDRMSEDRGSARRGADAGTADQLRRQERRAHGPGGGDRQEPGRGVRAQAGTARLRLEGADPGGAVEEGRPHRRGHDPDPEARAEAELHDPDLLLRGPLHCHEGQGVQELARPEQGRRDHRRGAGQQLRRHGQEHHAQGDAEGIRGRRPVGRAGGGLWTRRRGGHGPRRRDAVRQRLSRHARSWTA